MNPDRPAAVFPSSSAGTSSRLIHSGCSAYCHNQTEFLLSYTHLITLSEHTKTEAPIHMSILTSVFSVFFTALLLQCRFSAAGQNYLTISVMLPEPTVRPPSRMENLVPSSIAIGLSSSTFIWTLSPGMHISVPSGRVMIPVTSVVRK